MSREDMLSVFQVCLVCMFSFARGSSRHLFYGNFTLLPGQTLGHGYTSVDAASPAVCCLSCSAEDQCVAVTFSPDTGQCNLNDKNPHDYPVDIITSGTSASLVGFGRTVPCPQGWESFNRHCYLFPMDPKSWFEANDECISRQAMLVSVNDAVEYSFVLQNMRKSGTTGAWLGMNDVHGSRTWADGQPMSYSNFYPGEPNNMYNNQNCLDILDGRYGLYGMDDNDCDSVDRFVCEMTSY